MTWLLWLGLILCLRAVAAAVLSAYGEHRLAGATQVLLGKLEAGRRDGVKAVDDHSATATVVDGPVSLTLLFRFNDAGLIGSNRAESRGSVVGGKMVMAPWEGVWSNYQTHGGVQVPFTGEVAWMRPEGRKPYVIGTVTALAFEFSP